MNLVTAAETQNCGRASTSRTAAIAVVNFPPKGIAVRLGRQLSALYSTLALEMVYVETSCKRRARSQ